MADDTKPPVNPRNLSDGSKETDPNLKFDKLTDSIGSLTNALTTGKFSGGGLMRGATEIAASKISNPTAKSAMLATGNTAAALIDNSDNQIKYNKAVMTSVFATEDLNKVSANFASLTDQMGVGGSDAMAQTGQGIDQVSAGMGELYKNGLNLATGFKNMEMPDKVARSYDLYGKAVQVSRTIGLSFQDMTATSTKVLEEHGDSLEDTMGNLSLLKAETSSTGLSMGQANTAFGALLGSTKNMDVDMAKLTKGFGSFMKSQKEMGEQGYSTWKSPQQAAAAYGAMIGGVTKAQNDFSKAMFITGTTGGGLADSLKFMFEEDPTKNLEKMAQSLKETSSGGKLLTKEEGLAGGEATAGDYTNQLQRIMETFGVNVQDASKIGDQMAAGNFKGAAAITSEDAKKESKDALGKTLKLDDSTGGKLLNSNEKLNKTIGSLTQATLVLANKYAGKAIDAADKKVGASEYLKDGVATLRKNINNLTKGDGEEPTQIAPPTEASPSAQASTTQTSTTKASIESQKYKHKAPAEAAAAYAAAAANTKAIDKPVITPPPSPLMAGMVDPKVAKEQSERYKQQMALPSISTEDSGAIGDYSSLKLKTPDSATLKTDQNTQKKALDPANKKTTTPAPPVESAPAAASSAASASDDSKYYADLNIKLVSTSGKELAAFVQKDLELVFQRIKSQKV